MQIMDFSSKNVFGSGSLTIPCQNACGWMLPGEHNGLIIGILCLCTYLMQLVSKLFSPDHWQNSCLITKKSLACRLLNWFQQSVKDWKIFVTFELRHFS